MRHFIVIFSIVMIVVSSPAVTTTFTSTADTSISARDPNNNSGGHDRAFSGKDAQNNNRRALYRFDVNTIPLGSTINSAILTLTVYQQPSGGISSSFELHTMTTNWFEGTKTGNNGAPAASGESTWNNRIHSTTPWSTSAGANGDFTVTSSASTFVTDLGSFSWSSPQLAADVQTWVDTPGLNFGWIIISDNEVSLKTAKGFATRENAAPANWPVLEIDYSPPVVPPSGDIVIQSLVIDNSNLTLVWSGPTSQVYEVQYRPSLISESGWETVESNIVADPSGINEWFDPAPLISPSNAFFRIQGLF